MPRLSLFVGLLALAGCRPADEVRTYTVPKPKAAPTPASEVAEGEATDRVLGAFVPAGDGRYYSIKLLGPIVAVSAQADTFRAFVESVRVSGGGPKPPTYTVPAGWKPGPQKQMRVATFLIGDGPKPLEAYIAEPASGTLLANVNRWREQVGAKPVAEAELATAAPELKLGNTTARYVDARGSGGSGGMTAPFMKK